MNAYHIYDTVVKKIAVFKFNIESIIIVFFDCLFVFEEQKQLAMLIGYNMAMLATCIWDKIVQLMFNHVRYSSLNHE